MLIDYKTQKPNDIYHLMAQTVIPRPIAWIVTQNEKGVLNIAPFSYFIPLSSSPASLIVSIGHKSDKTPKDTLHNLRTSKKCTICICDESFLDDMNNSAKEYDKDISEINELNIKTKIIDDNFPPIVQNIPSAFFCTFMEEIDLKHSLTRPIILEVKSQYIKETCVNTENNKVKIDFNPIARIGQGYAKVTNKMNASKI